MFTSQIFRRALAYFPTGVSVVAARTGDGAPIGVTVNSFSSVSLEPPLVSVNLAKSLRSFPNFENASHFAINVLGQDQHEISSIFARAGHDKWANIDLHRGPAGSPMIRPNLAAFECESYARYEAGDHVIFVGRVIHIEVNDKTDPLVFFRSTYRRLSDEVLAGRSEVEGLGLTPRSKT